MYKIEHTWMKYTGCFVASFLDFSAFNKGPANAKSAALAVWMTRSTVLNLAEVILFFNIFRNDGLLLLSRTTFWSASSSVRETLTTFTPTAPSFSAWESERTTPQILDDGITCARSNRLSRLPPLCTPEIKIQHTWYMFKFTYMKPDAPVMRMFGAIVRVRRLRF